MNRLAKTLKILEAIDQTLVHDPAVMWSDKDSFRRNTLVVVAAEQAKETGLAVYWQYDWQNNEMVILFIELPAQVSWHVPEEFLVGMGIRFDPMKDWDGHTREDKSARIAEFVAQHEEITNGS